MKYAVIEFVFVCYLVLICAIGARGAVIEAEDYNQGGEGVAYHDSDAANHGNTDLRPDEGVDLWDIGDGVVKIGSVQAGEWVTFDYDFPAAGSYKITLHTATPHDAAGIILYLDGVEIQRWQALPNTGAYSSFTTVDAETTVDAGAHTIKIEFAGQSSDMDKLEIALVNEQPTVEPPAGAFQLFDYATYYGETGQQIQMAWDPVSNADRLRGPAFQPGARRHCRAGRQHDARLVVDVFVALFRPFCRPGEGVQRYAGSELQRMGPID
jgi:hypothetical protein